MPHSLSVDEIYAVQEDFVRAALMAREAGFDGVEVRESCYFTPFVHT